MSLRDMTVDIGFNADASPLNQLNKAMNDFAGTTNKAARELQKMSKVVDIAYTGMIDESKAFVNQFSRQSDVIRRLARDSGMSAVHLSELWSDMSIDMRKSLIQNHNDMRKFRKDLLDSEFNMRKLGMQMGHYTGSTDQFMAEIRKLGKEHKKITDQMINSNLSMRQGIIESIATMSAMSSQSEKITKIYGRMNNALLDVNKPFLTITSGLARMAREGNAAQLALKMLGPNAKMKDLQDTISVINQGIMRQQSVLMIASAAWLGFTAIMAHAALGPDPEKVRQQEANLTKIYRDAWNQRVSEISNFVGLFEKASIPKVKGSDLTKALQSQVNAIRTWRTNLQGLMKKGVDDGLIKELQKAGPAAAGQVKALNTMSRPELNKYVSLWREKMGLARTQATDELSKLREDTNKKIQDLQNSLTPLGKSWERFKSTWADALKPFIEIWGKFAAFFVDIGTKIGQFVQKLNEINPWITKIAGMFLYLASTILIIATPLAVGIGLVNGFKAAFAGAWATIGPFVEGLGAMAGTVLLVTGIIVGLGVAFYYAWNHSETFRNGVINAWNSIKAKAQEVWGFISPYIHQAMSAVTAFTQEKLAVLKSFWDQNGLQIIQAAQNVWEVIQTVSQTIWSVMKLVWPLVLGLIKSIWNSIKGVINGALNVIMGLVKIFTGLFTGDFHKMWEGIKQLFFGSIQFIWNYMNLMFYGRILKIGGMLFSGLRSIVVVGWKFIAGIFQNGLNATVAFFRGNVGGIFTAFKNVLSLIRNTASGIWNAISSTTRNVFGAIWREVVMAFTTIKTIVQGSMMAIRNIFVFGWNAIRNNSSIILGGIGRVVDFVFNGITRVIYAVISTIRNIVTGGWRYIYTSVSSILSRLVATVRLQWFTIGVRIQQTTESIRKFLGVMWESIANAVSGSVRRARSFVSQGFSAMRSQVVSISLNIKSRVISVFDNIVSAARSLPQRIGSGIAAMAGKVASGISVLRSKLFNGLAGAVNGVIDGINTVLDQIGVKHKIQKWKIPKYATGTSFHPGGLAIVGDGGGPELIRTPSGQIGLSPATSTLVYLPRGTEVLPHRETRALLDSGMFPAYAKGTGGGLLHQAWEGVKSVAGKAKSFALDIWSYLDKPSQLMKKIWDSIGVSLPHIDGAFGLLANGALSLIKDKAIGFVKKKLEGFLSLGSGGKGNVTQWIRAAMAITGVPSSWLGPLVTLAMHESGGNPRAINLWDSNARAGHPSKGLMQTIDSTFNRYKLPGMDDIWNPVHNAVAAIRYMLARYGSIGNVPGIRNLARGKGYVGYATGGIATKPQWATLAENGWKEYIIPTQPSMRKNALSLLAQANAELGYNPPSSGSTSNAYTPSVGGYSGGKTVTVHYNPHVEIKVEGNVDSGTKQSLKQEVEKILDDHYKKLQSMFESGVVI
jgi:SLT domain-containing protein/phage-related protein